MDASAASSLTDVSQHEQFGIPGHDDRLTSVPRRCECADAFRFREDPQVS